MYQNIGAAAYKKDLSNILKLDQHLGQPHFSFPTIHVAGTNGKGTTCHMIAAVLQSAGYKVGLYTSPHLKDFRERIKINGDVISRQEVIDFINDHKDFFVKNQLSFFEMTVGMAFQIFKQREVDIAVIEVGLGGRLDSTNIINPILSIITSIDLDHTDILGDTVEKIAVEKGGIIKQEVPVIINEYRDNLRSLFQKIAQNKNAHLYFAFAKTDSQTHEPEQQNATVTKLAIKRLNEASKFKVTHDQIALGLKNYKQITNLVGRYQVISKAPKTIADVAHNPAGIKALIKRINAEDFDTLHVVFGAVKDKSISQVLQELPTDADYYLCPLINSRGLPIEVLEDQFRLKKLNYNTFASAGNALQQARKQATLKDLILITGSTFLISEII